MMKSLILSVIIPVYQDWPGLKRCLDALAGQSYPSEKFEILVVQNDRTRIPCGFRIPPNAKIIQERKPGSYAARNSGLCRAAGRIIAFTDADCIPHSRWIEKGLSWLELYPEVYRVAGRINLLTRDPPQRTLAEVYELLFEFPQQEFVQRQGACATANLFCRHEVFETIGEFDDRYLSGGDIEWGRRAQRAGFQITYAEDVIVDHPARKTYQELQKKATRVGAGKFTYRPSEFLLAHAGIIKALVPPVRMFARAMKADVPLGKKLTAMIIHYRLKLTKSISRLRVAYGVEPERQ